MKPGLEQKLKKIRLIATDVDGVLTDGSFYIGSNLELKRFHSNDGLAFVFLKLMDFPVAVISGRYSEATLARTRALSIPDDMVYQDSFAKSEPYEEIKIRFGLEDDEIAYIGDDHIDTPILKRCGASFAPANAIEEVRDMVDHVTVIPGGSGAFREMTDMILHAQGKMDEALNRLHGLY